MSSTRPKGHRSGRGVRGCYAAALNDCGGDLEAEHFVSKNLLQQLGRCFTVTGPPWAQRGKKTSPKAFKAHVLCKRHNGALSPVDTAAGRSYRCMLNAANGVEIGNHEFDGDDLERWAIKLLLGANASNNIADSEGRAYNSGEPPLDYLQFLFGERDVHPGCGFMFASSLEGMEEKTNLSWRPLSFRQGTSELIHGVTIKVANCFQFLTTVVTSRENIGGVHLWHRPTGFVFQDQGGRDSGHIKLHWPDRPYSGSLILRVIRRVEPPHAQL